MELKVGDYAPDFTLPDDESKPCSLSKLRGKKIVLYFYPKDNTPGCTKEACSLQENLAFLTSLNTIVIGISADGAESHAKFKSKYMLSFHLLTDADHSVMKLYNAYGEKKLYGKVSEGVIRSTYIIDEEGKILKVYKKVNTATHGADVYQYLKSLS